MKAPFTNYSAYIIAHFFIFLKKIVEFIEELMYYIVVIMKYYTF